MIFKFKLTVYPDMDHHIDKGMESSYRTAEEMQAAKNAMASLLIFMQNDLEMMLDHSNMFVEEWFIDGEWEEFDS